MTLFHNTSEFHNSHQRSLNSNAASTYLNEQTTTRFADVRVPGEVFTQVRSRNHPYLNVSANEFVPQRTREESFPCHGVNEIMRMLPEFDPNKREISSVKFVERVEQLTSAYGWSEKAVLFAV